jgi:hypothetical protein
VIWLTFLVEWVLVPFFFLVFLAQKGKITRAFAIFFAILYLSLLFDPQYFILDNGTILTETTSFVYPTAIILRLFLIHLALVALATEFLFDDIGRDSIGRKRDRKPIR